MHFCALVVTCLQGVKHVDSLVILLTLDALDATAILVLVFLANKITQDLTGLVGNFVTIKNIERM